MRFEIPHRIQKKKKNYFQFITTAMSQGMDNLRKTYRHSVNRIIDSRQTPLQVLHKSYKIPRRCLGAHGSSPHNSLFTLF